MPFTTLISTLQLAAELDSPTVAIVDCRYDLKQEEWGAAEYARGHVPGAVYASLGHDLAASRTGTNGRHPLPSIEAMAATFSRFGITAGVQVVTYDQGNGMFASRLWWMLRYLGHPSVAVLDGGWSAWTREGRPTRAGIELRAPAEFAPRAQPEQLLTVGDVEALVRTGAGVLIDARAPERYEGRVEPIDRVAGHIPGARNLHHLNVVSESGTMLPPEILRTRFTGVLGERTPAEAVMYCGSGVTACHNLLAMEHAGLTGGRLYAGSWSEWSSDEGRPVETGPDHGGATGQTRQDG